MPGKRLCVDILTPDGPRLQDQIEMAILPLANGSMGILPGHIPMIARLRAGVVRLKNGEQTIRLVVSGGFAEVGPGKVTILADAAEKPEEIDLKRALEAKERAEARLRHRTDNLDMARAQASLQRAINRIKVVTGSDEYSDKM
jgi:F-type H+-transporting ATPase subunit epsilon